MVQTPTSAITAVSHAGEYAARSAASNTMETP